jgi:hypothetical protein
MTPLYQFWAKTKGAGDKNLFKISCPAETLEFPDENRQS